MKWSNSEAIRMDTITFKEQTPTAVTDRCKTNAQTRSLFKIAIKWPAQLRFPEHANYPLFSSNLNLKASWKERKTKRRKRSKRPRADSSSLLIYFLHSSSRPDDFDIYCFCPRYTSRPGRSRLRHASLFCSCSSSPQYPIDEACLLVVGLKRATGKLPIGLTENDRLVNG